MHESYAVNIDDCSDELANDKGRVVLPQSLTLLDKVEQIGSLGEFSDDVEVRLGLDGLV